MAEKKDFTWLWLVIAVGVIFTIAVIVYLNSSECFTTTDGVKHCLTGFQALKLEWPAFWFFAVGGIIVAALLGFLAYRNETKGAGSSGVTIGLVIAAVVALTGPWAKGCTDKVNGGITAPGYKNVDTIKTSTTYEWGKPFDNSMVMFMDKCPITHKPEIVMMIGDRDFLFTKTNMAVGDNFKFLKIVCQPHFGTVLYAKIKDFSKNREYSDDFEITDLETRAKPLTGIGL